MSYESVMLYTFATPTYNSKKKEDKNKPKYDDSLDANNPDNFNDADIEIEEYE